MAKASINFQKSAAHSSEHNTRKDKPGYLLPKEHQLQNEFWQHDLSEREIFDDELSQAKRKGGPKPKFENSRWEAVLNLNKEHSIDDVQRVAKHIEEKFNITCSAIALHRDEGHINERGVVQYNLHAHINFITYKNSKQNWRKEHIKPKNLSELQTEVAELLSMERGKEGSKAQRLGHRQFKEQVQTLAKQKDLKEQISELRAELQANKATRADYAKLEALNKELKAQIKAKDLTKESLEAKLEQYKYMLQETNKLNNELEAKISDFKGLGSLEYKQKLFEEKLDEIDTKVSHNLKYSDLQEEKPTVNKTLLNEKWEKLDGKALLDFSKSKSMLGVGRNKIDEEHLIKNLDTLLSQAKDLKKERDALVIYSNKLLKHFQNFKDAISFNFNRLISARKIIFPKQKEEKKEKIRDIRTQSKKDFGLGM
jgi:hypothetical protein